MPLLLALLLAGCAPPTSADTAGDTSTTAADTAGDTSTTAADTAGDTSTTAADTAPADTAADCAPLELAPATVELPVGAVVELAVEGCAAGLTVTCPPWAALSVPDPAAPGDVAELTSAAGWSGRRSGTCVVTWSAGMAPLHVELVTR